MTYTLDDLPPTPTAKDYYRLQFDPSNLPKKRIVGLLACQRDPLLRTLRTRVISAQPAPIATPPPQKGKNKARRAATDAHGLGNTVAGEEKGKLWELVTEDSVIFPEGGGQPTDTGSIDFFDPNGGERSYVVEGCLRRGLEAVHLVRVPENDDLGLNEGDQVELNVDWDRRIDHMAIHTSQHLISAILDTKSLDTLSWSLNQYPSIDPPYIELPRQLTWKEVEEVEEKCNSLIKEAKSVWVEASLQVSSDMNGTGTSTPSEGRLLDGEGEGDRGSRGIPKDYSGGVIRHINIEGVDRNACCGTHVPDLSHCGPIHLLPPSLSLNSEKPSNTPTRLYFTAGPRCIRYLRQASRQLSITAQGLGINREDVAKRVEQLDLQRREVSDREKGIRAELSEMLGRQAFGHVQHNGNVVWINRNERSTHDFEFIQNIAQAFISSCKNNSSEAIIIITSSLPGPGQTALMVVQSLDHDAAKNVNDKLKLVLDELGTRDNTGSGIASGKRVKGGGAKGRYMSKVEGKWGKREDEVVKNVVDDLRARYQ